MGARRTQDSFGRCSKDASLTDLFHSRSINISTDKIAAIDEFNSCHHIVCLCCLDLNRVQFVVMALVSVWGPNKDSPQNWRAEGLSFSLFLFYLLSTSQWA